MTPRKVYVVGVGMTKFEKPGSKPDFDYQAMSKEATTNALEDAGISYDLVEHACVGYVYGETATGQACLYQLGMTGIPVYNMNNACATGSSALIYARNLIAGELAECTLAMGFEMMSDTPTPGDMWYKDRTSPYEKHVKVVKKDGDSGKPFPLQLFGNAQKEYMKKYGAKPETFAKIAAKNHQHAVNNPHAIRQRGFSLQEVLDSPALHGPLTKLQCCPTSDGSACVILCSEDFVKKHGLESKAVEIAAMGMSSDSPDVFDEGCMKLCGFDMVKKLSEKVFSDAGLTPDDVQAIELHDCFAINELMTYESIGLCEPGKGEGIVERKDNTYGGKWVINPSGGLIGKGHPLGATGLAQCAELCWQIRGLAGDRQVTNCDVALQHNVGLIGCCVMALYKRAKF